MAGAKKDDKHTMNQSELMPPEGEKRIYNALGVYNTWGNFLHKRELFNQAKVAYDQGNQLVPDCKELLIGRAAACIDTFDTRQALKDLQTVLSLDPGNLQALQIQADAYFYQQEFEKSAIINHKGLRKRRVPTISSVNVDFKEGYGKSIFSTNTAIGLSAGPVLTDYLDIIKENLDGPVDLDFIPKPARTSRIPVVKVEKKITLAEKSKHELISRVLAFKYIGPMAYDKFFFEKLLEDKRLPSANPKSNKDLQSCVRQALYMINARQNLLRAQTPYTALKRTSKCVSHHLNQFRKELNERDREINKHQAERMLKALEKSRYAGKINDMMTKAERLQIFLDSKTENSLPLKDHYISCMYREIGTGYLFMHRLSYRLSERSNRRRIAFLMGITTKSGSFDSVIANCPVRYDEPQHALEKAFEVLKYCENPFMRCWLFYEISLLLIKVGNIPLSKHYAKYCQKEAERIDSPAWWLNGCFALITDDLKQHNAHDVKLVVDAALQWSNKIYNAGPVQFFLQKCSELASEVVNVPEEALIMRRERDILKLMEGNQKLNAQSFFSRARIVPKGRRFATLPLPRDPLEAQAFVRKSRMPKRTHSVLPSSKYLAKQSVSPMPGLIIFKS